MYKIDEYPCVSSGVIDFVLLLQHLEVIEIQRQFAIDYKKQAIKKNMKYRKGGLVKNLGV